MKRALDTGKVRWSPITRVLGLKWRYLSLFLVLDILLISVVVLLLQNEELRGRIGYLVERVETLSDSCNDVDQPCYPRVVHYVTEEKRETVVETIEITVPVPMTVLVTPTPTETEPVSATGTPTLVPTPVATLIPTSTPILFPTPTPASETYDEQNDAPPPADAPNDTGDHAPVPTPTATPTDTPWPTATATSTDTPIPTATPSPTPIPTETTSPAPIPTDTPTAIPPTETATPTATATFTSTPAPAMCDLYNQGGPLNFGPGDGDILEIEAGRCLDVVLVTPIAGDGDLTPDFVFYERLVPKDSVIYLDWVELQLSQDGVTWVTTFEWGDGDPANTANANIAPYGQDEDGEIDNEPIPSHDLYGDPVPSGILIDVDVLGLVGPFGYLRIISPVDGDDPAQIDAIEPLTAMPTPTPTLIPEATATPVITATSTITPAHTPLPIPTVTPILTATVASTSTVAPDPTFTPTYEVSATHMLTTTTATIAATKELPETTASPTPTTSATPEPVPTAVAPDPTAPPTPAQTGADDDDDVGESEGEGEKNDEVVRPTPE